MNGNTRVSRIKVIITLLAAVVLGCPAFVYHRTHHPDWLLLDGIATGISFAMPILCAGAVWLFLDGVRHFKPELQKSYRLLCIGIALFGLAQLQYGLIVVVLHWNFWLNSGLIVLPYLLFAVFMFMAMRKFAAILDIHGRTTSFAWAVSIALIAAVGFALLPHTAKPDNIAYMATTGMAIWDTVFFAFTAVLAAKIKRSLGGVYARPIGRLYTGMAILVIAGLQFAVIEMLMGPGDWYYDGSVTIVPFFVASLALLWAGYDMSLIDIQTDVANSTPNTIEPGKEAPLIDIILFVASLASLQSEIDTMLDDLRGVTSTLGADRVLSPQKRVVLKGVYLDLETYLTTRERLRDFNTDGLRKLVSRKFHLSEAAGQELWGQAQSTPVLPATPTTTQLAGQL